jgi:hypothetical protein
MEKPDSCIFTALEDCPKDAVGLHCKTCVENKTQETIKQAVDDYTSLGESFNAVFILFNSLMGNGEETGTGTVTVPVDHILVINRVINAFFSEPDYKSLNHIIYRRLIYYFFSLSIDEFNEEEYSDEQFLN